jgi:membrane-associated phospholipid phosphatase
MRTSEAIVLFYLIYLVAAAWGLRLPMGPRLRVTVAAAVDAGIIWWLSRQSGPWLLVRDWQPVVQILIGYELSGQFFQAPMLRVEAWLSSWDRWLFERRGLNDVIRRCPRLTLEILELAYLSVYVVLPLGFAVACAIDDRLDVDRYWSLVVLSELSCYATLPWIQTRPPRALNDQMTIERRNVQMRRVNDAVLKRGSIHVNTFPSGHAAGALATALAVTHILPAAGYAFAIVALGIVAGSIVGRYHYAADSLAGLIVAYAAWLIVR